MLPLWPKKIKESLREVTLEPVQPTPSHWLPQGSFESQIGDVAEWHVISTNKALIYWRVEEMQLVRITQG